MINISIPKHLYLFTSVKEELPKITGKYIVVMADEFESVEKYWIHVGWENNSNYLVTHWLDFDKLTTKQRAFETMKACWIHGFSEGDNFKDSEIDLGCEVPDSSIVRDEYCNDMISDL